MKVDQRPTPKEALAPLGKGLTGRAELDPSEEILQAVAEASPENPFYTMAFAHAQRLRGKRAVAFLAMASQPIAGCTGFLSHGRIHLDLEIPSAPTADLNHPIWTTIRKFCVDTGVTRLRIQSLGSSNKGIPCLGRTISHFTRREFLLDIPSKPEPIALSSNHRRNLRRAERAGIVVDATSDPAASETHVSLIDSSMTRRQEKGENATTGTDSASFRCLVETGAGLIFQARNGEEAVHSSMLVLLSERGAYYHSAGTSPEGMQNGTSQLLVTRVAEHLRERGIHMFNLGGASADQEGLARFKIGFGAYPVELETASYDVASGPRRGVIALARGINTMLGR